MSVTHGRNDSAGLFRRRRLLTVGALALTFVTATLVACSTGPISDDITPVRGVTEVRVTSEYSPAVIEVPVGTEVTWIFDDGNTIHDVLGVGWESGKRTEEPWSYTFETVGRFDYLCSFHPDMKGRVEVVSP